MKNLTNNETPISMVLLPQTDLDQMRAVLNEVKDFVQGKIRADYFGQWVGSEEARKLLGISQRTWQNYRDNKVIPFSQFGRRIYVKKADIDTFLESHMIMAN